MSDRKIIFLDIDGTLLPRDGVMPDSTVEALKRAKANGHELVICTGRAMCQLNKGIDKDLFTGFVTVAGSCVVRNGERVFQKKMTREQLDILAKYFRDNHMPFYFQSEEGVYTTEEALAESLVEFRRLGFDDQTLMDVFGYVTTRPDPEFAPNLEKALYYKCTKPASEVAKDIGDSFLIQDSSFKVTRFCDGEVTCAGVHKALGMDEYIKAAGASRDDSIAIGDGPNDYEMIQYAKTGIVMANGIESLKEIADFVTKSVDEEGIFYAFQHYGLI